MDGSVHDSPVGPSGGTVTGQSGSSATVPAGALTNTVTIGIAEDATGAPALPDGMLALGPIYAFTPHGAAFAKPVTVNVPFDATNVPSDVTPVLLQAEPGGAFTQIAAQVDGNTMTASVNSFSWFVVARDGTQGTLLVKIGGQPQNGSAGYTRGLWIRTGPAGSVYLLGQSDDALDDTYTGPLQGSGFVAKLTATLGFEWVRQYGHCGDTVSVGPTGNVYFDMWDSTGFIHYLQSVNSSGATRAGFPIQISAGFIVTSIVVDAQDDPTLLGWTAGSTSYESRAQIAGFSSSGQVKQAMTQLTFGSSIGNNYTTIGAAVENGAGLFFSGGLLDFTTENAIGTYLQHVGSSGSAAAGFPVVDSTIGLVSGLVSLPATTDVVELVEHTYTTEYQMVRYRESGTIATGFPRTLDTGSTRTIQGWSAPVSDGQGNVYFGATLELPYASTLQEPQDLYEVLSYTSDGALRAGYPMLVGYQNPNDTNPSTMVDMAVDATGTTYFAGNHVEPKINRTYLAIERLPAH